MANGGILSNAAKSFQRCSSMHCMTIRRAWRTTGAEPLTTHCMESCHAALENLRRRTRRLVPDCTSSCDTTGTPKECKARAWLACWSLPSCLTHYPVFTVYILQFQSVKRLIFALKDAQGMQAITWVARNPCKIRYRDRKYKDFASRGSPVRTRLAPQTQQNPWNQSDSKGFCSCIFCVLQQKDDDTPIAYLARKVLLPHDCRGHRKSA